MDNIGKTELNIFVKRGSNLMYNDAANSVIRLFTVLDDAARIQSAKKEIAAKMELAKKAETNTITHRIGLISFKNPSIEDLNVVQKKLIDFYIAENYTVELFTLEYGNSDVTSYLTVRISRQSH